MPPDGARKVATLAVIALVIVVSVCLRPPLSVPPLTARPLPIIDPPLGVRPGSLRGQTGVRPGSEHEYVPTQVPGTVGAQEMRTLTVPAPPAPLIARHALAAETSVAPTAIAASIDTAAPGHVSRALSIAGRQTSGAFRIAGRAIRSAF